MDERKRTIRELEDKRRQDLEGRDLLLENLGETLFSRLEGKKKAPRNLPAQEPGDNPEAGHSPAGAVAEHQRLLKEIADSREIIKTIEEETQKLKELEEQISAKEEENSAYVKELAGLYEQIGELALGSPDHEEFSAVYKGQLDPLLFKIESQEEKLEELEDSGGGFFSWLGGSARSVVIKALLAKNQASLKRLYRKAGEKFVSPENAGQTGKGEIVSLKEKIDKFRQLSSSLSADLAFLRGEKRKAAEALGVEGNPAKRIQGLEKQIAHTGEEIRNVYRRFSAYSLDPAWKGFYGSLLTKEDSTVLGRIKSFEESIQDTETHIEKLKAAIAIDEEKAEIEKLNAGIEAQRRRIAAAEESIADMRERIAGAETHIAELTKLL
jgi:predicted  nucleic acid-binding Zn-ribbon protein